METLKISVFPLFPVSVLSLVNQLLRVALYVLLARIWQWHGTWELKWMFFPLKMCMQITKMCANDLHLVWYVCQIPYHYNTWHDCVLVCLPAVFFFFLAFVGAWVAMNCMLWRLAVHLCSTMVFTAGRFIMPTLVVENYIFLIISYLFPVFSFLKKVHYILSILKIPQKHSTLHLL